MASAGVMAITKRSISGSEKSVPAEDQQSKRLRCAAIVPSYGHYVAYAHCMRSSTTGRDLSSARVGRQAHSELSCHRGQCNGVDHFPKGLLNLSESRYYGFFAKSDGSGSSLCFDTAAVLT